MDLNDMSSLMPTSTTGLLGTVGAAVIAGAIFLRQYLSRGAADRADDAGRISAINVYKELLEAERAARALADQRADGFAKERNEAVTVMGELRGQLKAVTEQLKDQTDELAALRSQVRGLKEQIDAKP